MLNDPMMNTFFSLLGIVVVLGLLLLYVKKLVIKSKQKNKDGMGLEVLSRFALQPKTNIFVVKVGNKKLLIGANEHSINTLADLTEESPASLKTTVNRAISQRDLTKKTKQQEFQPSVQNENLSFKHFLNQTFRKS